MLSFARFHGAIKFFVSVIAQTGVDLLRNIGGMYGAHGRQRKRQATRHGLTALCCGVASDAVAELNQVLTPRNVSLVCRSVMRFQVQMFDVSGHRQQLRAPQQSFEGRHCPVQAAGDCIGDLCLVTTVKPDIVGQIRCAKVLITRAFGAVTARAVLGKEGATVADISRAAKGQPLLVERNDIIDNMLNLLTA